MSAELTFSGIEALVAGLRAAAPAVRAEVGVATERRSEALADELRGVYQGMAVTGTAAARVDVRVVDRDDVIGRVVRARAPHAHLIEWGSIKRYTKGTGANRGTMPAGRVFVPRAVRARAALLEDAVGILKRQRIAGFEGTADVRRTGGK